MRKTELAKRYLVFLIGLFINSLGVCFVTKANLGTSPISSIPYVFSLGFEPTLGNFTILFSVLLIILQIIILGRKFQVVQLIQIPVSIVFGYFIDYSMMLLDALQPDMYGMKVISLLVGCLILGTGVYIEVIADVVMLPGEAFVKSITARFKTDFGITKICFDASMAIIAGIISLSLFHQIEGVREGTIIAACVVGLIAKQLDKILTPFTSFLFPNVEADNIETENAYDSNCVNPIDRELSA